MKIPPLKGCCDLVVCEFKSSKVEDNLESDHEKHIRKTFLNASNQGLVYKIPDQNYSKLSKSKKRMSGKLSQPRGA